MIDPYPPVAFSFRIRIDGADQGDASFLEARGIGPEFETEEYREGGENRFVHQLPKGVKHPRLSLQRGVANKKSGLVDWCRKVLEGGLALRIEPRPVSLYLLDAAAKPIRGWTFSNAWPVSWSIDPFHANKNEAAIEKVEFVYGVATRTV